MLTVILTDKTRAGASEVLGVLADWSAVGLLQDFCWLDVSDGDKGVMLTAGVFEPISLAEWLGRHHTEQVRGVVLDVANWRGEPGLPDPEAAQERLAELLRPYGALNRLHLLALPIDAEGLPTSTVPQGMPAALLSPVSARIPGSHPVRLRADAPEWLVDVALQVASVAGVWRWSDGAALLGTQNVGAPTLRVARSYMRFVDATPALDAVVAGLLGYGELPRPMDALGTELKSPPDPTQAAEIAADSVLGSEQLRHLTTFDKPQLPDDPEEHRIGLLKAIKTYVSCVGAALRKLPAEFSQAAKDQIGNVVEDVATRVIYGGDSVYRAVLERRLSAEGGEPAQIRRAEAQVLRSHNRIRSEADAGLLWHALVEGGLDLLDGGARVAGMDSPRDGERRLVVGAGDVAPVADAFTVPVGTLEEVGELRLTSNDPVRAQAVHEDLIRASSAEAQKQC